jgi:hypothetical protein
VSSYSSSRSASHSGGRPEGQANRRRYLFPRLCGDSLRHRPSCLPPVRAHWSASKWR